MSSYHPSPWEVLLVVGDMETDPGRQEICLLPVNDAKRNQRRRIHDDTSRGRERDSQDAGVVLTCPQCR